MTNAVGCRRSRGVAAIGLQRAACFLLAIVLVVAASGCKGATRQVEYRCPMHPEVVSDRPGDCPVCGMRLVATKAGPTPPAVEAARGPLYVCPMHPQVSSSRPGKCTLCGMDLVEREPAPAGGGEASGVPGLVGVTVPAAKRELIGMTTGEVAPRRFLRHLRAPARIVADESRLFRVTTPEQGFVDRLYVRGTGDVVRKGQPLLELYSPNALVNLRRDLYTVSQVKGAEPETPLDAISRQRLDPTWAPYELLMQRIRRWGLSDDQIQTLSKAPEDLEHLVLYATVSGSIAEKSVIAGQSIAEGEQLFVIADLTRVWAEADLAAADGPLVQSGTTAEVEAPALPGRSFSGRVTALAPFLDPQTRTQSARIELDNPNLLLHPGLPAIALLTVDLGDRLAVPSSAVLRTGELAYSFRVADGDRLVPVEVQTGIADGEFVEVLAGLGAGDRIVTSATFLIDSESAMAAALQAVAGR